MRAKQPVDSGYVERDGVRLAYEVFGDGPQTLVFPPAWTIGHSRVFKSMIPYFSEHFRCVTYDPRGNGKSDRPDRVEDYVLDAHVVDALAVMDATNAGRAVLVGLSFSGMLSCVIAAYHPERVAGAILLGTAASVGPGYSYNTPQHFMAEKPNYEGWNKYDRAFWLKDYASFADHFIRHISSEPHSTKQIEDGKAWAAETTGEVLAKTVEARLIAPGFDVSEAMFRRITCPMLVIHGENDQIQPVAKARLVAELTGAEFLTVPGGGHIPHGRFPAFVNSAVAEFLERRLDLGMPLPNRPPAKSLGKRALYLSSPIGLGHGRRDIAITRELRKLHPDLQVDWLAQDPVTRLLDSAGETIHPLSPRLANESRHIELESGEHELHCFQSMRRMDEVLAFNFMLLQDAVKHGDYDLVIADEAWDVDHYWHEHPELKKAKLAWLTDFVGFLPMPSGGAHEAYLTTDYNAEMIGHVERHKSVRDRAIFVGTKDDIVPLSFGRDLPDMRDWVPKHFDFAGYVIGEHPSTFGPRADLRRQLGYRDGEKVAIVTVGGSGVGAHLIRRILQGIPIAQAKVPELRVVVVAGPRIDPASLSLPQGVEVRSFVPDLDRHLAACDVALVQGGLTTCMELTAAGTPFVYFPLKNHFEQNFHVAHRLQRYGAGIRLDYETATPDSIADALFAALHTPIRSSPVEADGAIRAARMISELL